MMDVVTIVVVLALGGWSEWRFRQVEKRLGVAPKPEALVKPSPNSLEHAATFSCYYCGHQFPAQERERIGAYNYCPEHGSKRQEFWLSLYTAPPKEVEHDNRTRIHTTDRRSEQRDNDQFPWVS